MKSSNLMLTVVAVLSIVSACNYTTGECWPRGQSESAGAGGGVIGPVGVGGYGDVPPGGGTGADACNMPADEASRSPSDESGDPADTWIDCRRYALDPIDCMMKCAEIGISCAGKAPHPKKSGVGLGDLVNCKNGWPTNTCSYLYPNGDTCIYFSAFGYRAPMCVYTGGKK